jgi:hypothetical protein
VPYGESSREGSGIRIYPRKGRALIFWSVKCGVVEDENSLHAAEGEPLMLSLPVHHCQCMMQIHRTRCTRRRVSPSYYHCQCMIHISSHSRHARGGGCAPPPRHSSLPVHDANSSHSLHAAEGEALPSPTIPRHCQYTMQPRCTNARWTPVAACRAPTHRMRAPGARAAAACSGGGGGEVCHDKVVQKHNHLMLTTTTGVGGRPPPCVGALTRRAGGG